MRKTITYTLLCTTVLASGVSLGMDQKDGNNVPKTPQRVAQLKEGVPTPLTPITADAQSKRKDIEKKAKLLETPELLKSQTKLYPEATFPNPAIRTLYIEMGVNAVREEREKTKSYALEQVAEEENKKRLIAAQEEEEKIRLVEIKRQEQLFARATATAEQNEKENKALLEKLDEQAVQIKLLEQDHLSAEGRVKSIEEELAQKTKALEEELKVTTDILQTLTMKAVSSLKIQLVTEQQKAAEAKEKLGKAMLETEKYKLKLTTQEEKTKRAETFIESKLIVSDVGSLQIKGEPSQEASKNTLNILLPSGMPNNTTSSLTGIVPQSQQQAIDPVVDRGSSAKSVATETKNKVEKPDGEEF